MTDKVHKIRKEVERLRNLHQIRYQQLDTNNNMCLVECGKRNLCNELLSFIDSLQEEPVSDELEEAALLYYDKNRLPIPPEWDLHKEFIDFFKAGAEWQKNHLWKPADVDDLPEYEREVVVFTQNFPDDAGMMMVAIGHRPNPDGWDGKSLTTGEVEHYTPKTYGKGGWNIPNVVLWLDLDIPKL